MENFGDQLKNIIKGGSRPTNLSFSSQKIKICISNSENNTHLDDGSTSTDKGPLVSGVSIAPDVMLMGTDSRGSQAVKSNVGQGEACQTVIKGKGTKSNTHQDGGSTRKHRKGKGKKNRRTSQSNTYVDEGSPGKTFLAKVDYFRAVKSSKVVKGETTESTTHQDDGSETTEISQEGKAGKTCERTDVCSPDPESNALQDDGSTASAAVLGGEFNCTMEGEGETCPQTDVPSLDSESTLQEDADSGVSQEGQKTDVHPLDAESNNNQDDGSTASAAASGGEFNCLTTTEGKGEIYQRSCVDDGSTASPVFLGGFQDGKAFLRKLDGFQEVTTSEVVKDGPYPADAIQQLQFRRNTYVHQSQMDLSERDTDLYDGLTTKESISPCNDPSVPPTVMPMSGKVQRAFMESLPSDIVQDILCRIPAECVLECKLVCKRWETLASGSNFANMHLARQLNHLYDDNLAVKVEPCLFFACQVADPDVIRTLLFNGGKLSDRISRDDGKYVYSQNLKRIYHPPMHKKRLYNHLVGSCNGLVCATQHHHLVIDPIYIFNPLTREYVYLPQLFVKDEDLDPDRFRTKGEGPELGGNMHGNISSGFGYVRSTNEYKVVRIHYVRYDVGIVQVYTLGSGCGWRSAGMIPYRLDTTRFGMGVCLNDAIYWTTYESDKVVAFDLVKEEFRVLPHPPCMRDYHSDDRCGLVALGRQLCLYMDKLNVEIWSLMESSESEETWRMEYDIDYEAVVGSREMNFRPILLTEKGEIIFLYDESLLYSYDTKTTFLKMISDEASADYFCFVEVIAHVNTFVSLEAIGENSKRYTGRPRRVRTPWDDVINELDRVALGEEIDTTCFRLG